MPVRTRFLLPLALALALAACGKGEDKKVDQAAGTDKAAAAKANPAAAAPAAKAASAPVLLLAAEDLRTVQPSLVSGGPLITGTLQPERRADLRSEVSAVVTQVLRDNGEAVKSGELLVRLDDTAIRDSLMSAEESARAAAAAFEQAERSVQRLRTLQQQGMTSAQALEDAEVRRNAARSETAAANSRVVSARQQLRRTEVRAPFEGVVSDRKVSAGDTAAVGKELLKVIDPKSLRFEGLVSADRMVEIKPGLPVSFEVTGVPQGEFRGTVKRVDAAANATTRQVAVLVAFNDRNNAPRMAGLFAEGRIESGSQQLLMLPEGALVRAGEAASVWRLDGNRINKVAVKLGERDARRGEFPVLSGLKAGDRILRSPGSALVDGQSVELARVAAAAASAAAASR
jgi:membrane fusion protein, multidrug efflux system